ncbi:HAD family hydrolase [Lipingzhangella sp. LS1_29]|uniref:HAD family hydrolase n=1 Tax=Lipingzhangella rawalii TaxID=2055835 RepID=A0ABU2H9M1_9ACTN|nr:HAD family hydrolase [Lipingzhangella rawalii]MDS1271545.1 HAD family hydrolase [Lipingzhangella rawalii]
MTIDLGEIMRPARWILLDFDGPVCSAFAGYPAPEVAGTLREQAHATGVVVPDAVMRENDPMRVLSGLYQVAPQWHADFEAALTQAEIASVAAASPTPGVTPMLGVCRERGLPVAIVSNNSPEAIRAFVAAHHLDVLVDAVIGRDKVSPELMKPNPYLLRQALAELGGTPDESVMVGDSTTDIEAARAAGTMAVGYANRPGKAERWRELKPDAIIGHMGELAAALRA